MSRKFNRGFFSPSAPGRKERYKNYQEGIDALEMTCTKGIEAKRARKAENPMFALRSRCTRSVTCLQNEPAFTNSGKRVLKQVTSN
jgi:hypothetical protein